MRVQAGGLNKSTDPAPVSQFRGDAWRVEAGVGVSPLTLRGGGGGKMTASES